MAAFKVLSPGLSTTIQDLGRERCLDLGIPVGGAADVFSHRIANAVLANEPSAATLEMMLIGPRLEALEEADIAVAGADMHFQINGAEAAMGHALQLKTGDVISFGKARRGCFGYLAVRGGFAGAQVLGSRSTYVAGRLGGHFGRALHGRDRLASLAVSSVDSWTADDELLSWPLQHERLRFVRGPQPEYFTEAAYRTFVSEPYTVSPRSNRMAYRLTGPALEVVSTPRTMDTGSGPTDIIEDGNAVGAIQIAGGIEPICMGRDCPTSGAYAKIGCIITPDVSRMSQMQPGDTFQFEEVSVDEAYDISAQVTAAIEAFGQTRAR